MDVPAPEQQLASPPAETPPPSEPPASRSIIHQTTRATTFGTQQEAPRSVKPNDKHLVCELIGDVKLTFKKRPERLRAKGHLLPNKFYRTAYENSATMSQFVTPDCLVKHRDVPHLKLHEGNAFQNVGDFIATRDMVRPRIERQLKTQMKKDPSPFVSMFDDFTVAEKKAETQYNQSRLVGHRVYIAEIETQDLIPATLHGEEQCSETWYLHNTLTQVNHEVDTRSVKIPVWVRSTARPADHSSISIQQLVDSHADIYVSIAELRVSDLEVRGCASRDHEWLSCGPVPMSAVTRVMPYDGRIVHQVKGNHIVQSRQSIETYLFDWSQRMWKHNPDTSDISHFRNPLIGDKRKRSKEEKNVDEVLSILKGYMLRTRNKETAPEGSASPAPEGSASPEAQE